MHNATGSEQAKQFAAIVGEDTAPAARVAKTSAKCKRGMAGNFPCDGIDMLSRVSRAQLGLSFVNDIWGWTDPRNGKHYALIGGAEGTVFVNISKPRKPNIIGTLPTHSKRGGDFWRDIKVYDNHAFIVSEQTNHQMQVFDLRKLRGVKGAPKTFRETALYDVGGDGNTHNLNINTDTGYAYLVGTSTCQGGLHMVDIKDPASPTYAGCFDDHGYIHDTQCVIYEGPDTTYAGREICFNANAEYVGPTVEDIENTLSIVDVTDKENPVALSRVFYGKDGYSHQGWLDGSQSYYIHGDELDEDDHRHQDQDPGVGRARPRRPGRAGRLHQQDDLDRPQPVHQGQPVLPLQLHLGPARLRHLPPQPGQAVGGRLLRPLPGERRRDVRGRHLEQLPVLQG